MLLEIPYTTPEGKTSFVVEVPNRSLTPHNSYTMRPGDMALVMRDHPDQNLAAWHTHPGGLIGPSTADVVARPPFDILMLVVALTPEGPVPLWF